MSVVNDTRGVGEQMSKQLLINDMFSGLMEQLLIRLSRAECFLVIDKAVSRDVNCNETRT